MKGYSNIPKVDVLMESPELIELLSVYRNDYVLRIVRDVLEEIRQNISRDKQYVFTEEDILGEIADRIQNGSGFKPVINATGVVLHTNLGRSPMCKRAMEAISRLTLDYNNLEFDLKEGKRGSRYSHLVSILRNLTGCEDAMVVNNNASAVMLVLNALAKDREVIVARSQLVEIGGSFRIPSIMQLSGAKLVEVGTTNCNHLYDYEQSISEETAMIMKVHRSNFTLNGYVTEVEAEEMAKLAKDHGIPFYEDLGSGAMYPTPGFTAVGESIVERVKEVDILSFSGDKFLGGPQAGIILGKKKYIDIMKKAQLSRALRVGKLTIAALEATLYEYTKKEEHCDIRSLYLLNRSYDELYRICEDFAEYLDEDLIRADITDGYSLVGGDTMPEIRIKTPKISINLADKASLFSKKLRTLEKPIIITIRDGCAIIDFRCIEISDLEELFKQMKKTLEEIL